MSTASDLEQKLAGFREDFEALRREIAKRIVGLDDVIEGVLTALVAGGHVLVEGLPGMGKTALARTLAGVLDVTFQRIQCTADLMPTDAIGTYVIMETPQGRRTFEFQRGPLFANVVLIDQVNRAMPKTQSALLEAMDERSITVSTETFRLPEPYFLLATQNPLELDGTYPLPAAQVDRFLLKLVIRPPDAAQLDRILEATDSIPVKLRTVADGRRIGDMTQLVRQVPLAADVRRMAVALVTATHPEDPHAPASVRRYVRHGVGPRGAQAMVLAAKVRAVLDGRYHVAAEDLRAAVHAALRHRLVLNYEGMADNVQADTLLDTVLEAVAAAK
jgi:MoxR-like ATPase